MESKEREREREKERETQREKERERERERERGRLLTGDHQLHTASHSFANLLEHELIEPRVVPDDKAEIDQH